MYGYIIIKYLLVICLETGYQASRQLFLSYFVVFTDKDHTYIVIILQC